jgi:hypothetical protein
VTISFRMLSSGLAFLTTIFLSLLVSVPSAAARTSSGAAEEHVKVVAHLALNGMHVNHMFVQQRGSEFFLYLHRPIKDAFALVDVTNPDKPVLLSRNALKEAPKSQVQPPTGDAVVALTVTPDAAPTHEAPAAVPLPTETVQFVDISNPKSAKTLKTFKGVTSVYSDDARKLVYLVNGEGLWIVSHHMSRAMPLCSSEDAMIPNPDCQ